jgi:hypothetical protein
MLMGHGNSRNNMEKNHEYLSKFLSGVWLPKEYFSPDDLHYLIAATVARFSSLDITFGDA